MELTALASTYQNCASRIKKLADYFRVFIDVNLELIEDDQDKKNRKKRTSRYPISSEFIEATHMMREIVELLKKIKVVSVSEVKNIRSLNHDEDLAFEMDDGPGVQPTKDLRSMYDHFCELRPEQQRVRDTVLVDAVIWEVGYGRDATKSLTEHVSSGQPVQKRALPRVYIHEEFESQLKPQYKEEEGLTKEVVQEDLKKLMIALARLHDLCDISARPLKICGKRRNCCNLKMISLFQENK